MTRDQSEGLSSGFSTGVTRRLNIWWTAPAPERWTPARPRRALVLRDFLPNRALVSSRARTCCAPRNGLRRIRLTTEAHRRRRFASGDDAVAPSTRRGDISRFHMRVETTTPD